ncbi:spermidine/putrescine transport system permease protein [Gemmobacter aquatilis]|uniref:Spermidine/putrescine transport system permease protein n=1 Tax=Gemmobacter aquatilis TaxID=933059 RepID=A0A1H8GMV0_9RHOB|nr:ABC transporter permease [Gemmobacter aquatilis]SEN45336.1 spermidine/putrescine transport system permease protein [Gemmobacter aquatilis]
MDKGNSRGRFRDTEAAKGLMLVSPTALYATLLLAAPLFAVVVYSLMIDSKTGASAGFTFNNYIEVWTGKIYQAIMLRSLIVSMTVTLITVLLAYPVAYFVSFGVSQQRKALWLFLITIPFWTSYLIRVFMWKVILGYNGVINSGLMSLGIIDEPLTVINYSVGSMVATLAHAYAPFAILPIFVSLEKIDRSLLEAGQDLGESKFLTFWRVTLPLSMPGVIAAVLIVFIPTIGDYVTPELIGGGKIPMIANMIEVKMLKQNDKAMGSAIAVTAMVIVAAVSVLFLLLNKRFLKGQSK